jgi:hypothetical protein
MTLYMHSLLIRSLLFHQKDVQRGCVVSEISEGIAYVLYNQYLPVRIHVRTVRLASHMTC